ncbi:MAG: alpha-glucuronidase family glycosyl hydrolase [Bacteroidetes bacterium]|nr:alpha-glucuronidase family glycosyl hydrolase [Bacteroidota bacterium]
MKKILFFFLAISCCGSLAAENGYECWLRYTTADKSVIKSYRQRIQSITLFGTSSTIDAARFELSTALLGLLGKTIPGSNSIRDGSVIAGTTSSSILLSKNITVSDLSQAGTEGFVILSKIIDGKNCTLIIANSDIGVLYGVFHFLRLLQTAQPIQSLHIISAPRIKLRLLNHWDNLNRTVERGYAGSSIWNWHTLPGYIDQRYTDYARLNASIGINGTVLTNVNANATALTRPYLEKVAALANTFRPYGIKVYLTARFSAPIEIGGLKTADPLDPAVRDWWKQKADEIYSLIPDFGGFLVKANSEGQPGPQNYNRTHADGANMMAAAVAPHKGIIMWRAFVYSSENPDDRHKQAYIDFTPLDGKFADNVLVQVKNGPIDFMPREPFHPLFGAMPKTPLMMEFQLTQEYTGQGTHLVYLAPMFKECLESDTYAKGEGSTVAKVVDGSLDDHSLNGMAGVSNIGADINWCGHPFAQANWYALGRLSWDHQLSADTIADEWVRQSFSNHIPLVRDLKFIMLSSREIMVQYMNPLGLHHIMGTGHHYGPAPWVNDLSRPEWNPVYYHRADSFGIGFDRTKSGSNAIAQYKPEATELWRDSNDCDERYLLWFHHVCWNHRMRSGQTLWTALCMYYNMGVDRVSVMKIVWEKQKPFVDAVRFKQVSMLLDIQYEEACWWRDACLLYFQTFSKQPIKEPFVQPTHTLDYYKQLRFPYAPGN